MIALATILWAIFALFVAFLVYAHFVEPTRLRVTRREVHLPSLPPELDGVVIAHLSDLHCRPEARPLRVVQQAIAETLAAQPDLICLSGDICHHSPFLELGCETVAPLAAPFPQRVLAVLGNHDHDCTLEADAFGFEGTPRTATELRSALSAVGLTMLHNEACAVSVRGRTVAVLGIGDAGCGRDDLDRALAQAPSADLKLAITHSPDALDLPGIEWADLVLCGHTHGGQFALPGLGTPWAPVWRDRRRSAGLFAVAGVLCHVSRGVGAGTEARFLCPPEVVLLTLRRGEPNVPHLPRLSARGAGVSPADAADAAGLCRCRCSRRLHACGPLPFPPGG